MNAFEILMSRRWVTKKDNKDLYYKLKDNASDLKKFFTEKLGFALVVNPHLVKLEKIPSKTGSWMGIDSFTEKEHYIFFCLLLMYLEDKEAEEQFILSDLLEYIQMNYSHEEVDWTLYHTRKNLVRVIKVVIDYGMVRIDDGTQDQFVTDYEQEVLYENTGISRYFMRNFGRDIQDFNSPDDFNDDRWIDVEGDRGVVRRQKVYRKLLESPAMIKEGEDDESFAYLKNYRNVISSDLEKYIDCILDVHKTSAFLVLGEECNMGKFLPSHSMNSDLILLVNSYIQEAVRNEQISVRQDDRIIVPRAKLIKLIEECRQEYNDNFSKTWRDLTTSRFVELVMDLLRRWEIVEFNDNEAVKIYPIAGKIAGTYKRNNQ